MSTKTAAALNTTALSMHTPLGWLHVQANTTHLLRVWYDDALSPQPQSSNSPILQQAKAQLEAYFDQKRTHFKLPLATTGTAFQQEVRQALCHIPYGETRTYQAIARAIGRPKSVRAVGQANASNPLAIVIPCHRVIGKNGDLQGYAFGLDAKQFLLNLEQGHLGQLASSAVA